MSTSRLSSDHNPVASTSSSAGSTSSRDYRTERKSRFDVEAPASEDGTKEREVAREKTSSRLDKVSSHASGSGQTSSSIDRSHSSGRSRGSPESSKRSEDTRPSDSQHSSSTRRVDAKSPFASASTTNPLSSSSSSSTAVRVIPPPPADYFLPPALSFTPRSKKVRPSSESTSTNSAPGTRRLSDTGSLVTNPSPSSNGLSTSIPTGPRIATNYQLGPNQNISPGRGGYINHNALNGTRAPSNGHRDRSTSASEVASPKSASTSSLSIPSGPSSQYSASSTSRSKHHKSSPSLPPKPDHYKPRGTKDFKVIYDPTIDPSPVKRGKEVISRYDGEGVVEIPSDPRKATDRASLGIMSRSHVRSIKEPLAVYYTWDINSTGPAPPPPPCSILVTGFPSSTTPDQLHRQFSTFGRIANLDNKTHPQTGGSLGICRITFVDDIPKHLDVSRAAKDKYERDKRKGLIQDGNQVAREAIKKGNGTKIGARMMLLADVVTVVMDGDGILAKVAVEEELAKRNPAPPPPPPHPRPLPPSSEYRSVHLPPPPPPPRFPAVPQTNGLPPSPFPNQPGTPFNSLRPPPPPPPPNAPNSYRPPPPPPAQYPDPQHFRPNAMRLPSGVPWQGQPQIPLPPRPALAPSPYSFATPPTQPRFPLPTPPHQNRTSPMIPPTGPSGHNSAINLGPPHPVRQLPTDPYVPIVFSGVPALRPSSFKNGAQASAMSKAVAAAVLQAKQRLDSTRKKKGRKGGEEEEMDMELSDSDEAGDGKSEGDNESAVEEKIDDEIFFHSSGRMEKRKVLQKGRAPAAAIAWQASPQVLKEKLITNGYSYVSISKSTFYAARKFGHSGNPQGLSAGDLEHHFREYDLDRTFADSWGWYITFIRSDSAKLAFSSLNQQPFAGALLVLSLMPAATISTPLPTLSHSNASNHGVPRAVLDRVLSRAPPLAPSPRIKKESGWTDAELIEEAKELLVADLVAGFKTDLKNRLISGKVWEHLEACEKTELKVSDDVAPFPDAMLEAAVEDLSEDVPPPQAVKSLPSFTRKKDIAPPGFVPYQQSRHSPEALAPESRPLSDVDHLSDRPRNSTAAQAQPRKVKKEKVKRRVSPVQDASSDEEAASRRTELLSGKVKKVKKVAKPVMDYTSSEEEELSGGEKEGIDKIALPRIASPPLHTTPLHTTSPAQLIRSLSPEVIRKVSPPKKKVKPKKKVDKPSKAIESPAQAVIMEEGPLVMADASTIFAEVDLPSLDEVDDSTIMNVDREENMVDHQADIIRQLIKEAQRPKLVRKALRASRTIPDPFEVGVAADAEDLFYLKLAIERPRLNVPIHPTPPPSDDESEAPPRHPSGSARTEGYYVITVAEKLANRPSSQKARTTDLTTSTGAASGVAVSRLARANTRGLVRGMEMHKKVNASDTDVLKFNQLRTRKKQLTFSRSGIEGYGLFAKEHIPAGEMVIEYVGELVRQQVADRREKAYERQGIGSSYLFRVDEDLVVDATKKGNLGRLINHCCAPNCTARIITINGVKKIVIYAKTNIEPGDEVTYDYHFPHEEVKIPCLCAHPLCRKYLN